MTTTKPFLPTYSDTQQSKILSLPKGREAVVSSDNSTISKVIVNCNQLIIEAEIRKRPHSGG